MIQLNIRPEDKQVIAEGRYTQVHPRVMQKYDALHLKDCGLSRLNEISFNQPESDLQAFSTTIEKYLEENPPQSISEAAAKIEALTGIKRGETQVRKFLKDKGFKFRRVGTVPAKALTEEKKTSRETFWSWIRNYRSIFNCMIT
ncbi:hypothetical protein AGMMS50239_22100 [Bacteroidia bacterium]|nr:hypothetical protein AGMMS50239_22100 [Bacteroidia bacterium]